MCPRFPRSQIPSAPSRSEVTANSKIDPVIFRNEGKEDGKSIRDVTETGDENGGNRGDEPRTRQRIHFDEELPGELGSERNAGFDEPHNGDEIQIDAEPASNEPAILSSNAEVTADVVVSGARNQVAEGGRRQERAGGRVSAGSNEDNEENEEGANFRAMAMQVCIHVYASCIVRMCPCLCLCLCAVTAP